MGCDKALLPFGPDEVLLQRVVRSVSAAVPAERIVCVAAADQALPTLPDAVQVVRDPEPQRGPLAGLATGIEALATRAEAVFFSGCDMPFLVPAFIERMFELLGDAQVAIPQIGDRLHPLAAVYRVEVLPIARSLLAIGEGSLHALVARCDTRLATSADLQDVDPEFATLIGCNTPDEYQAALERIRRSH
jgi:molybdopterin-guanine dinucleotide biosynthesis protein A